MKHTTLATLWSLALLSCNNIPTAGKIEAARIGEAPDPEHARQVAQEQLRSNLCNYDEARIAFAELQSGFYAVGAGSTSVRYAWMLTAWVDDMNTYGFYEGVQARNFFFLGDKLVATAFPEPVWTGRSYRADYQITEIDGGGLTAKQAGLVPVNKAPGL